MLSDNVIQKKGYEALIKELGEKDATRFINSINNNIPDYTEWRKTGLDQNIDPIEFEKKAMEYIKKS